ncbi:unnamed protein product [Orchesella dallaii]|uniref:DUF243 domain-containing protein n=1 Tax=Orchesella dallaii TaxID=48710 RepID=A0ABP1R5H0_9HEXA
MRIIPTTVILLLWTTKRLTEATLPGIATFFLPPPPPPTEKVLVVHLPSPSTPQPSSPPQNTPAQQQSGHFQNEFRLHQLEHSTFVSTNNGSGSEQHNSYHLIQQGTPFQKDEVSSSPSHNQNYFPAPQGQGAALSTNYVLPQERSSSSYHQPVPLTFPPSSSLDSHSLPRIISLPPYPSQQLPQKSTYATETDTTSSSSYSFTQGFRPSYGPPKTTKVVRHVSVFVAPPQDSLGQNRQKIRVQGQAEKHVNIIFIKNPDTSKSDVAEIELPPSPEQKTYVYVLNKAQEGPGQVIVNTPEPPKYNPADVFFIRYKNPQGQQQGSYGPPPQQQQHQPSSEYGAPSNQNFNYTLPSYSSVVMSSSLGKQNKSINSTQTTLEAKPTKNTLVAANKQLEEETHYHLHDLNYVISQQRQQQLENKQKEVKLEQQQHGTHNQKGFYEQIPRDSTNGILQINRRKDGGDTDIVDAEEKAKQEHNKRQQEARGIQVIASNAKPVYNTVADIVGDVRHLLSNNANKTTHQSNSSFTGDNSTRNSNSNTAFHDSDDDDSDISVLTKRNLTTITSGDGDDDTGQDKGSTGDVSGRPDDFRPYKYAPALDYNYFGVIGYKAID